MVLIFLPARSKWWMRIEAYFTIREVSIRLILEDKILVSEYRATLDRKGSWLLKKELVNSKLLSIKALTFFFTWVYSYLSWFTSWYLLSLSQIVTSLLWIVLKGDCFRSTYASQSVKISSRYPVHLVRIRRIEECLAENCRLESSCRLKVLTKGGIFWPIKYLFCYFIVWSASSSLSSKIFWK